MTRQLWAAILASMLIALCGSLLASLLGARAYLSEQLALKNMDNATALALSLSQGELDDVRVELAVAALFDSGHYQLIRVRNPHGRTIVERASANGPLGAPRWFVELLPIHADAGSAQVSQAWRQYGTVTVLSESRFAYAKLWSSAAQMAGAMLFSGLVAGYLGSLILRRLFPPLRAVVEQAVGITQRRFAIIPLPKVPELAHLANAMNTMVGRLKTMFELEAERLEAVRREANFDSTTGAANRAHFLGRVTHALGVDASGGVLLIVRIADLAEVNQRLGRQATDELLRSVAQRARQAVAGVADALVGRLSGADLAILQPARGDAAAAAGEMLERLLPEAQRYGIDPHRFVHVGAVALHAGIELAVALAEADTALAAAEAGGQGNAVATAHDEGVAHPRSAEEWRAVLGQAIARKWARLQPFPVLDAEGADLHWECPLRLRFAEDGDWQPAGRFLPVVQRLGMTRELDLLAVELGIAAMGGELSGRDVAINLSPQSIAERSFREQLVALVARHRALGARLWLEVAETGALLHLDALALLCRELAPFGCRIGIEHFGREFSQIGRLHHLGLAYVKADSSFVREIDTNAGNQAFLRGLCSIAHAVGLQAIAEGVTSGAELDQLLEVGFDGVTGPGVHRT